MTMNNDDKKDKENRKTIGKADRIRVSPNGSRVVIMLKGVYKILEPGIKTDGIPIDSDGLNGDTVFWGQDMFALAMDKKEWGNNLLSFFRTNDGSRLGILDCSCSTILYNSTAFKRNPTGILDTIQLMVYPAHLKTIIHIGGA